MQNLCKQVKVYHIHNHYYCCQEHSKNNQKKTKRKAISFNNNFLSSQTIKNIQIKQSFKQQIENNLINSKFTEKSNRKGISLSLKGSRTFENSWIQINPENKLNNHQSNIIQKYVLSAQKCKQISYVNAKQQQQIFKKQNLCSTKESNYENSLFFSTNKKQIKQQNRYYKSEQNLFKSLKLQTNQETQQKKYNHLSKLILNSCQSLHFNQKHAEMNHDQKQEANDEFEKELAFNQQKEFFNNSKIQNRESYLLNFTVKSNNQINDQYFLNNNSSCQESVCTVKIQQSKMSKNNFILTAQERARIIDRQTIVSHYFYDQTQINDSYILDQSLIVQREIFKKFIKKSVLIQNEVFTLYQGIDMQLGTQVCMKQYKQRFRDVFQLQKQIYAQYSKEEFFQLLQLKQTIQGQNLVLIKQGFKTTLEHFLNSLHDFQRVKQILFYLLSQLNKSLKQKNLSLSSQCNLSDFVLTQQKKIQIQNPFVLKFSNSCENPSIEYLANKLTVLFLKTTEYQIYS